MVAAVAAAGRPTRSAFRRARASQDHLEQEALSVASPSILPRLVQQMGSTTAGRSHCSLHLEPNMTLGAKFISCNKMTTARRPIDLLEI